MVESLPHRTATADAPIAWIPRSVLEAIGRSAEYGHPHPVDGELFGYWIAPGAEVVVVDWDGFGSLMFREPYFASTDVRAELEREGVLTPRSDLVRVPLGIW